MHQSSARKLRNARFDLRATKAQRLLINKAALMHGVSTTDYILTYICEKAEQDILDQKEFSLSAAKWKAFSEALDRPVTDKPGLKRLFSDHNILDRPE